MSGLEAFEELESEVRSYVRAWPAVWSRAHGASLWDEDGREYLDFFSGAGGLNYGHNDPAMIEALTRYLQSQGIIHSLDMATTAKRDFLQRFDEIILKPRGMAYKVMFPGPTGTNAVEASLKLARKVTGRQDIVSFTNAFHGMTLGSLALSGNVVKRESAGIPLEHQLTAPFDGELGEDVDTIGVLDAMLSEDGSSVAGVIVETVQGEGGLHSRRLRLVAATVGVLPAPRRAADRRRHPGRVRPHGNFFFFRARRNLARCDLSVQVNLGQRTADVADADPARARHLVAG